MIQKYTTSEGKILFSVRVYKRSRKNPMLRITRQAGSIETEAQAKRIEDRMNKEINQELSLDEAKGTLFGDLARDWFMHFMKLKVETGLCAKVTHEDNFNSTKKWFDQYFNRPAVELNSYEVFKAFEALKANGVSFKHRKRIKGVLKNIFDYGIQMGQLPTVFRSPTYDVLLKREVEKKPEILGSKEIELLISKSYESAHDWRRIWVMALLTGMRSGELYALEWSDVDFDQKLININKSYNCRLREIKSAKAGYCRQVPISSDLEEILKEQRQEVSEGKHVFPRSWEWDKGLQAKVLRRFCYSHGLPSIKFHTLRACFATQMLQAGVEAAKVMKICGWKELKTMQFYVRLAGIEVQGVTDNLKFFRIN